MFLVDNKENFISEIINYDQKIKKNAFIVMPGIFPVEARKTGTGRNWRFSTGSARKFSRAHPWWGATFTLILVLTFHETFHQYIAIYGTKKTKNKILNGNFIWRHLSAKWAKKRARKRAKEIFRKKSLVFFFRWCGFINVTQNFLVFL